MVLRRNSTDMVGVYLVLILGFISTSNGFNCPYSDGNYAHEVECNAFYKCVEGRDHLYHCPPTYYFNADIEDCDRQDNVPGCVDGKRKPEESEETPPASIVPNSFHCPDDGNFAHPTDCRYYYWCVNGVAEKQACPPGTLFSTRENLCTWPNLVNECSPDGTRNGGDVYVASVSTYADRHNIVCDNDTGLYPHPDTCTVYFWCIGFRHLIQRCPPNTLFSTQERICTWPHLAPGCDIFTGARTGGVTYSNKDLSHKRHRRSEDKIPKAVAFQSEDSSSYVCPEDYGYFPHPTDCAKYYWCLGPVVHEQNCSDGLLFNTVIQRCSWSHTVKDCDHNGRRTELYTSKGISKSRSKRSLRVNQGGYGPGEFKCPAMDGTYRHPSNCSIYYVCKNGHSTKFVCNLGSVLNPVYNNCDWPVNVPDCDSHGIRIGSQQNPQKDHERRRKPRSPHKRSDADRQRQSSYTNFRCPYRDGFYGHPVDCRVYYWCINHVPTKMLCAGGTFFNSMLGNCAHIKMRSDCDPYTGMKINYNIDTHGVRKKRQTDEDLKPEDHNSAGDDTGSVDGDAGNAGVSYDFQCPERNGHYADDHDCTSYYWCVDGRPLRQTCTDGTVYNPLIYSCDHAWKVAGCSGKASSYQALLSNDDKQPSSGDFQCPSSDGHYAHPLFCEFYFWCVNGKANMQQCGGGTVFNPDLHMCDHAWRVPGCESTADSYKAKLPSDTMIVRKKRSGDIVVGDNDEYVVCPPMDGTYRHHKDCTIYYKCNNGYPTVYSCSGGSVYNPETYNCGWYHQVKDCDENGRRIPTASLRNGQVGRGSRRVRSTQWMAEREFRCPSSYGYFRHPTDCRKYYWCVKNKPTLMSCLGNNYFDLAIRRCHWPWKLQDCDHNGMRRHRHKRSTHEIEVVQTNSQDDTSVKTEIDSVMEEDNSKDRAYFKCPDQDGYYRHSIDCKRYYWCVGHQVTEVECARGTVYNPDIRGCDMPYNVPDCDSEGLRRTQYQSDLNFQFQCPKGDNSDGYYRHLTDCTRYYRCSFGKRTSYSCTPGTYFDPVNTVCTWPGEVIDCDQNGKIIVNIYKENLEQTKKPDKTNNTNKQNVTETPLITTISTSSVETTVNSTNQQEITSPKNQSTKGNSTSKSTWWMTVKENSEATKLPSIRTQTNVTKENTASTQLLSTKTTKTIVTNDKMETTKLPSTRTPTTMVTKQPVVTVVTNNPKSTNQNERKYVYISVKPTTTDRRTNPTYKTRKYRPITTQPTGKPTTKITVKPIVGRKTDKSTRLPSYTTKPQGRDNSKEPTQNEPDMTGEKKDKSSNSKNHPYLGISAYNFGFKCPYKEGYFRDMTDCAAYFHCRNGVPYRRDCQADHYYSPGSSTCIPAYLVTDCHVQVEPTPFYYPENIEKDEFLCPELFGYFPDPNDCASYFECLDGRHYRHRCMQGTFFDQKKRKCTWENLVANCPSNKLITTDDITNGFFCPAPSGLFRDPTTCTLYFECVNGVPQSKACVAGTFFDVNKRRCIWSKMVNGCDEFGRPKPIKQSVFKNQQAVNPNNFDCPLPNGHFRDVRDCSRFYHCVKNVAYSGKCKDHNAFDVYTLRCVPREEVEGCDIMPTVPLIASTTPAPLDFRCPKSYGYFRDYYNCSVYYYCVGGVYFRHTCKSGSVFHKEKSTCTWPHLVPDCQANGTIIQLEDKSSVPDRKQSDYDTETVKSNVEASPTMEELQAFSDFRCPAMFDGFYGDYLSCTKFYRCVGGKRYDFVCPNGTFFDKARRVCNFLEDVIDCSSDGFRITAAGENQNEIAVEVKPLLFPKAEIDISESRCPESDGLFADPNACDKFIYCSRYVAMVLPCPDKLLFNVEKKTCDYSDNVVCVRYD